MKTIIAGSRTITDKSVVYDAIWDSGWALEITEVVSGHATGVDHIGEGWARKNGARLKLFPTDWKANGKAAGHIRNRQMGDYAEALIAVWDGQSRGTKGMIDYARRRGLKVFVCTTT